MQLAFELLARLAEGIQLIVRHCMILGVLGAVEVGLVALDIDHGKGGVQAAIDWLGRSVRA